MSHENRTTSLRTRIAERRFLPSRGIAALCLLTLTTGLIFATTASQAANPPCPTPGNFEIDGDMMQATCAPPADDWNTAGLGVQTSSQGGTYNTSNKDADPTSGWTSGGGTPDKADFQRAYSFARVVGGHYFVFLAWERTATAGTQSYNIELDNSGTNVAADGTPQPNRANGGTVFYIDAQGGGLPTFGSDCTFTSQADYGSTCSNSSAGFTVAFNTAAITDPLNGNAAVAAGGFDEIALDVTALTGIAPSCPSPSAASLYLRSATGNGHKNLKGYLEPFVLQPDSTCVPPPITTTATPGGPFNPKGATQNDTVTVGNGNAPGVGSVKFFLCSPAEVIANGGDCSANGTLVSTKTLNGNGQAASDNITGATDNATGKYCWRAEFTPTANDHHYLPGSETNSDDSGVVGAECFTIVHASPTIGTQIAVTGQNAPGLGFTTLGDTATLSNFAGNVAGETINFSLYGPFSAGKAPDCTGAPVFTTTGTLNGGGMATTSQTFTPIAAGTYVWVASYPQQDLFNDAAAGSCTDANESATIVASQITLSKSANPAGPVSAGDSIGFDITVTNPGAVPATNVHVTDPLPSGADGVGGGDLNWSLSPAYAGCSINGAVGAQTLDCTFNQVDPGALPAIHITSQTALADCGAVKNKATATTTNGTGGDSNTATVAVQCPNLNLTKTADHATVSAGDQIGFTITASNSNAAGTGTAEGVVINDPLPAGNDVDWSINPAGPANCSINGAVGAQTLTCTAVDLAPGQSESVHIVSDTTFASCQAYLNAATIPATANHPVQTAQDTTTVQCPNLNLTKTADHATVSAGDQIGFTITASNSNAAGTGTAEGVVINDPLPAGNDVDWSINPAGPANCSINGAVGAQTLTCTAVDLAPGQSESVHIVSDTTFASCQAYLNAATIPATANHPVQTAQDTTTVQCPNLNLTKTADHATVSAGDQIGFTITASNSNAAGTGTAEGVVINDPLPAGNDVDWSINPAGPANCSINGAVGAQTLTCTAVDLAPGQSESVHIVSDTTFASCQAYLNAATIPATANHPVQTAQDTTTVQCPNLNLTKTADHATVSAGDAIGFKIHVANAGPGTAKGVTVKDPLPAGTSAGWTVASTTIPAPGACAVNAVVGGEELDCTAVDLGPGASYDIHITAGTDLQNCTLYDNTATASQQFGPDATGHDSIACLKPGLNVLKTADAHTVSAGDPLGFTIVVGNGGPGVATSVTLKDPLPAGTTPASWTVDSTTIPAPGGCAINNVALGQELDCTAIDMPAKTSYTVHIRAATDFADCTTYDNTATASATNALPANGSDSIQCNTPSLSLTKTADANTVDAGDAIGFKIHVANGGPGTARNVTLKDPLPAGTTAAGWTIDNTTIPAPGSCTINAVPAGQELDCTGVDLNSGDSYDVHISAATDFADCTTYDNTATASQSFGPDATGSDSIQCNSGLVSITKTADHSAPVNAGDPIGFTVEIKNTGKGRVTGAVLNDTLPAGSGSGVTWAIDPAVGTPAQFVLGGAAGAQTLSLASGTLPAGADFKVHVTAATSETECGTYDNTATLTTRNANDPDPANARESCAYRVDLSVTKAGSPATQTLGAGNITWTIAVTNNGPDADTGVKITDPTPGGNTFVSASSTQGTCTGGAILSCDIGTMAAGATVTITLVTTPSTVGAQTNTVTVSGDRPETNTANNTATATVQTTSQVITPPPVFCVAVSKITPQQLFVGRKTMLTIHVTQDKKAVKGIHVRIKGPKLNIRTKASNARGVIKQAVRVKKAGVLIFDPIASKRCNTKRVGVTNVFTPPVTG